MLPIRAITLHDTIWPIAPTIARAEQALRARLERHAPRTAARWPAAARQAPHTHRDHKDTLSA